MDDCDWLLSVEKACDWLRIEPGVTVNFFLGHPVCILDYYILYKTDYLLKIKLIESVYMIIIFYLKCVRMVFIVFGAVMCPRLETD